MLSFDQTAQAALDTRQADHNRLINALLSGGDSRLTLDSSSFLNKYLCPAEPTADILCASSCTASPITSNGFNRAKAWHERITQSVGRRDRTLRLDILHHEITQAILTYYDIASLARVILCPSGTDALEYAARLMAAQSPTQPITAILPAAAETGSGVPAAVGESLIFMALRDANGQPLSADAVASAYAKAAHAAHGRAIIYLTPGTKTGLMTADVPADTVDVIVDACQTRVEPTTIQAYLHRGWPVVITGSKFFGGPAFSGAVLLPNDRFPVAMLGAPSPTEPNLGMLLRWIAAVETMEAFRPLQPHLPTFLRRWNTLLTQGLAKIPTVKLIGGLRSGGADWEGLPSIHTIAVRDQHDPDHFLSIQQLKPIYERLGCEGVLLGQPVDLGPFGGLRIAIGARDIIEPDDTAMPRILSALQLITSHTTH